jgi:hypothetical protein
MSVKQSHYEELLAEYSNQLSAIALLRQYRPYLETVPSMRRPEDSLITIPLPIVRVTVPEKQRDASTQGHYNSTSSKSKELVQLPCDVAILMCDPEWKIKTGVEILVFIHRPHEDFSDLLGRWRQTQVWLDRGYEWLMPPRHQHILSEGDDATYPLFVTFAETPERVKRGLRGAGLPFVTEAIATPAEEEATREPLHEPASES